MRVRVLAFARLREVLGASALDCELPGGASARDLWAALASEHPALAELERSTRLARDGRTIAIDEVLGDGDEVALLPPYGGG